MVGIEKIPENKLRWNTNEEILLYLSHASLNPHLLKKKQIARPKNGAILLYDRTKVRYKSDGYEWKKRKDGKNVREDHMKLKVNGVECLYGAYVHNESVPNFHRRCYWKLKTPKMVLVHYLYVPDEAASPLTSDQFNSAISQLKHIFNVSESELLNSNGEYPADMGSPAPLVETDLPVQPPPRNVDSTKASQLLLILNKNGADHQLKKLIYQDRSITSEDKNTQTEKCCHGNNSNTCCHDSPERHCNIRSRMCSSPIPCSSSLEEGNVAMTTLLQEEQEGNSLLVGKHNPILNNSINNILMDDTNPFIDSVMTSNGTDHNHTTEQKSDCDHYFNDANMKNDLASLKDKDSKLFELFEETAMSNIQTPFLAPDILPMQRTAAVLAKPLREADLDIGCQQENIPVGQKRKYTASPDRSVHNSGDLPHTGASAHNGYNTVYTPMMCTDPVLPTAEFLVQISAISPDWAYLSGGEKVVLVGDWEHLQGRCCVLFGNTMVAAQQLRAGVIQVICPATSHPGLVTVHMVSDGVIFTNSNTQFTYKELHAPSNWLSVVDSNFKYSLINRLEALESQVRMLSSPQYTGDLQTRMCSISLPILRKISRSMKLPPAPRGLRLVHLAAAVGYSRLLLLLLRFPALPECNPSSLDDMGNNALVWACVGGHTSSIYILLRFCPRVRGSRDGWGRSIRDLYRNSVGEIKGDTAARTIQLHYRTYKQKKQNAAAIRIQSRFRTYKQQCNFEQMRRAVVIIQQSYRDHMKQKEVAAKTIQRCWRQTSRQRRVLGLASNTLSYY